MRVRVLIGVALLLVLTGGLPAVAQRSDAGAQPSGAWAQPSGAWALPSDAGAYRAADLSHPRLLLRAGEEASVREAVARQPEFAALQQRVFDFSAAVLDEPVLERVKIGKRLLAVSREALKRIFYLSYTYRITGDVRMADRAIREMEAVCDFVDWNPQHFLDVGEMGMAVAIGYDWLYDRIPEATRTCIRSALLTKGFEATCSPVDAWFYTSAYNWNPVCNGGLVFAAVALWDEVPDWPRRIVDKARESCPIALKAYSPEGGYPEGYGYWAYGTSFQVLLSAALEGFFGTDFGLAAYPGFLESAAFMRILAAPTGKTYNFMDSGAGAPVQPAQFWIARRTGDLSLLWNERKLLRTPDPAVAEDRLLPFLLICGAQVPLDDIPVPAEHSYRCGGTTPLYVWRSGWTSPDDTYLAVKGGSAGTNHGHVDAGSFIFESDGLRWVTELGNQAYHSIEKHGVQLWDRSQGSDQYEVYRIGPWSHNILTANGECPLIRGYAPIVRVWDMPGKHGVAMDMTEVMSGQLRSAWRSVWLDGRNNLHVRDHVVAADAPAQVRWAICTPAQARIEGGRIVLSWNGHEKVLSFRADGPGLAAEPHIWPCDPPPNEYDAPNPGFRMVGFTFPLQPCANRTIEVKLITSQ